MTKFLAVPLTTHIRLHMPRSLCIFALGDTQFLVHFLKWGRGGDQKKLQNLRLRGCSILIVFPQARNCRFRIVFPQGDNVNFYVHLRSRRPWTEIITKSPLLGMQYFDRISANLCLWDCNFFFFLTICYSFYVIRFWPNFFRSMYWGDSYKSLTRYGVRGPMEPLGSITLNTAPWIPNLVRRTADASLIDEKVIRGQVW